jgi:hypothetical protein
VELFYVVLAALAIVSIAAARAEPTDSRRLSLSPDAGGVDGTLLGVISTSGGLEAGASQSTLCDPGHHASFDGCHQ